PMMRNFLIAAALFVLAGCASNNYYNRGHGGADYYYGEPSSYYYRGAVHVMPTWCSHYGWYGTRSCYRPGWAWMGPYAWGGFGGFGGWGWPNPWRGFHGNRWYGSLSLGFGSYATWGYPGYYNPWFGA